MPSGSALLFSRYGERGEMKLVKGGEDFSIDPGGEANDGTNACPSSCTGTCTGSNGEPGRCGWTNVPSKHCTCAYVSSTPN